jgi:hypothetical protein
MSRIDRVPHDYREIKDASRIIAAILIAEFTSLALKITEVVFRTRKTKTNILLTGTTFICHFLGITRSLGLYPSIIDVFYHDL